MVKISTKEQRCIKCIENHLEQAECSRDVLRCYHCKEEHEAGNKNCIEYKYQEEVMAIQA